MKIKYIHRVIEFKQSKWLAPYIDFNTEKRKLATTDFEKNLYKLCNNAVFGKMCEDLRKRIDVRIVAQQPEAERCIAKPTFDSFKIINDDITMVQCNKTSIMWRKPTYVGFTILELSKLHMYKFHYDHIVPHIPRINVVEQNCYLPIQTRCVITSRLRTFTKTCESILNSLIRPTIPLPIQIIPNKTLKL